MNLPRNPYPPLPTGKNRARIVAIATAEREVIAAAKAWHHDRTGTAERRLFAALDALAKLDG